MAVIRPETEMKDSGVQWLGDIPASWKVGKVKHAFYNTKTIVGDKVDEYERLALTLNGVIKRSKEAGDGLQPEKFDGYQILTENELVFKLIDLANVSTSRVGLSPYTGIVSPAYIVLHDRRDGNPRYAEYYFLSMWMNEVFNHLGGDGVRSALNAKDLLNIPFLEVPISEQQAIADYLDEKCSKIDEIIAEAKASVEEYKELRMSVISNTVLNGIRPCDKWQYVDNKLISKIPSHWKICKVKNIASYVSDGAHVSPETDNGVYDFISTVNLQNGDIQFENCLKTSIDSYNQLVKNGCKPQMNDVLISKDGTVGKTTVIDYERDFVVASSLVIIRPVLSMINPYYLEYNLQAHFIQETLQMLMSGAGLKRVSVGKNATLPVVLPPLDEQQEIVDWLNECLPKYDALISEKQSLISDLEAYKKSLIYEVVTGKRRVV